MLSQTNLLESVSKEKFALDFQVFALQWQSKMENSMQTIVASQEESLGSMEEAILKETKEAQRNILEKAAQAKADKTPPHCPRCGRPLSRLTRGHKRQVETRFGVITVERSYGYCKKCDQWFYPADLILGLNKNAGASPGVQEMAALAVSKMPVSDAAKVVERLSGVKISPSTLDREARRQGEKACEKRDEMDRSLGEVATYKKEAQAAEEEAPASPYTFVIEADAWNIRERDDWGKTKQLRKKGEEPSRWHWVYGGTCFCLDNRVQKGERPIILRRGYVMTRGGVDALSRQLKAEAIRQGMSGAAKVLVIADGALWLWNMFEDAFKGASQRLDYFHASAQLWEVAHALFGEKSAEAKAWVEPLLKKLKQSQAPQVISHLEELKERLHRSPQKKIVGQAKAYLESHSERLDYKEARQAGEPIGSGAMESTCRQYQCRFKRPGQFWTQAGDEGLMALETFWRNDRWHFLFPHSKYGDPAKN